MCYFDLCDTIKKGLVYNSVARVHFYTYKSLVGAEVEGDGIRVEGDGIRVDGDGLKGLSDKGYEKNGFRVEGDGIKAEEDDGVESNGIGSKSNEGEEDEASKGEDPFDDDNVYLVKVRHLSDGKNDDELQAVRQKLRQYKRGAKIN
ncbi:hypothetical protein PTKIN_Ptkin04bG0149800 [Pterospermum kingtungense]